MSPRSVTFTVSGPVNGEVRVGAAAATSFTGAQLAAGQVSFVHDGSDTTTASFQVSVEDGNEDGSAPAASPFNLTVTPANDPPVLTGDLAATVTEGGTYVIAPRPRLHGPGRCRRERDLHGLGPGQRRGAGRPAAVTSFTGAQLAAGQVSFVHDGSDTTTASFQVSVEDGNEDGSAPAASTFNLTVTPANDPPVLTGDLAATVTEGGTYVIAAHDLGFTDAGRCRREVTFTVTSRSTARCWSARAARRASRAPSSQPGRSASCMTAATRRRPRSRFRSRTATRMARRRPPATFNLTVTPANDPPVLTGDLAATVTEGGSLRDRRRRPRLHGRGR